MFYVVYLNYLKDEKQKGLHMIECAALFTIVSRIITTKINHYSLITTHYSLQSYYSLFNPVYTDAGKIAEKGYP